MVIVPSILIVANRDNVLLRFAFLETASYLTKRRNSGRKGSRNEEKEIQESYAGAYNFRNANTKHADRVIHEVVYPNT